MTAAVQAKTIQATVEQDKATVDTGNAKIEISRDGKVTIFSDELTAGQVQHKPAIAKPDGLNHFAVENNGFSINGVKVELLAEGLTVHANGEVPVKTLTPLEIGQKMEDGSFFAGLTKDGKQQIFAMAKDIKKGSAVQADEAIKKLNANKKENLGHADWQIGSVEVVQTVRKNLAEGALKDSFKKAFFNDRYHRHHIIPRRAYWGLTSTKDPLNPSHVATIRFTEEKIYDAREAALLKVKGLTRSIKKAFDKKHFYADMKRAKSYKSGSVRYESKDTAGLGARPVRLVPVPTV